MKNEKLENQKINENSLKNVAGGYDVKINYVKPGSEPSESVGTLFLHDNELKMVKELGILNPDGSIDEENLNKVQFAFLFANEFGKNEIKEGGKNKIKIV